VFILFHGDLRVSNLNFSASMQLCTKTMQLRGHNWSVLDIKTPQILALNY
jgi:hypothetical protein